MNWYNVLAVGAGGFLGTIARYLTVLVFNKNVAGNFPYATLSINIAGSFLLGLIAGYSFNGKNEPWKLFLTTGFCGGFTTFSTFALENINLWQQKMQWAFLLYILLSLILGITAAFIGLLLGKSLA